MKPMPDIKSSLKETAMKKRCFQLITTIIFAILLLPQYSFSAIYKWTDKQGQVHVTDYPNPDEPRKEKGGAKALPSEITNLPSTIHIPKAKEPQVKEAPQAAEKITKEAGPQKTQPIVKETVPAKVVNTGAIQVPVKPAMPEKQMPLPQTQTKQIAPIEQVQMPEGFPQMPEGEEGIPQMPAGMPAGLTGLIAGLLAIIIIIEIALYIFFSLCMFLIAKKLDVSKPWIAWIPIVQIWTIVASARKPWWWLLLLLVPLVNIFIGVYLWMCITENLGRNKWLGLIMLVPLINLAFLGFLAFSKAGAATPPEEGAFHIGEEPPQEGSSGFMESPPSEEKSPEEKDLF